MQEDKKKDTKSDTSDTVLKVHSVKLGLSPAWLTKVKKVKRQIEEVKTDG